ncbi:MAG: hypothetical protein OK457_00720 [Thaumarchaeota archaeon]|nr:hypothetical protein [Nitrososphaerota archaeon]
MILALAALVVAALAGFGLGRVKNAAKLAAVKAEIAKLDSSVTTEVAVLVIKLKSLL